VPFWRSPTLGRPKRHSSHEPGALGRPEVPNDRTGARRPPSLAVTAVPAPKHTFYMGPPRRRWEKKTTDGHDWGKSPTDRSRTRGPWAPGGVSLLEPRRDLRRAPDSTDPQPIAMSPSGREFYQSTDPPARTWKFSGCAMWVRSQRARASSTPTSFCCRARQSLHRIARSAASIAPRRRGQDVEADSGSLRRAHCAGRREHPAGIRRRLFA